jgi:hypothetical protein
MGDRKSVKAPVTHVERCLANCVAHGQQLMDEVWCQLMKQLTGTKSPENLLRGWRMMAVLTSYMPASASLLKTLAVFLQNGSLARGNKVLERLATFSMARLAETRTRGTRKTLPSLAEIQRVEQMQPAAVIRVFLQHNVCERIGVYAQTTVQDVASTLSEKFSLPEFLFGLDQCVTQQGRASKQILQESTRIMDKLMRWNEWIAADAAKHKKSKKQPQQHKVMTCCFLFNQHVFFRNDVKLDEAPEATYVYYLQAVQQYLSGMYPASQQDGVALAALTLQVQHGDVLPQTAFAQLATFVPLHMRRAAGKAPEQRAAMEKAVRAKHATLKGTTKHKAMAAYVGYALKHPRYGIVEVPAQVTSSTGAAQPVLMSVSEAGVAVVDPKTRQPVRALVKLHDMHAVRAAQQSFSFGSGPLLQRRTFAYKSAQAAQLKDIVNTYRDLKGYADDSEEESD